LCKSKDLAFEPSAIDESWHRCLAVIHHFREHADSADRVEKVLKIMDARANDMSDNAALTSSGFVRSEGLGANHQPTVGNVAVSPGICYNESFPIEDIFGFPSSELFHDGFPFDNNLECGILDDLWSNVHTDMNFNE
jgi:hypothetical protein